LKDSTTKQLLSKREKPNLKKSRKKKKQELELKKLLLSSMREKLKLSSLELLELRHSLPLRKILRKLKLLLTSLL
jgi:hypothetical protein